MLCCELVLVLLCGCGCGVYDLCVCVYGLCVCVVVCVCVHPCGCLCFGVAVLYNAVLCVLCLTVSMFVVLCCMFVMVRKCPL